MNINTTLRLKLGGMLLVYLLATLIVLPANTQAATNLIPNPGFESSSTGTAPDNWIKGKWGTNTATFSYPVTSGDGSKAVSVSITAYTSGDAKWAFAQVPVIGGHTYEYTDMYSSNVSTYITLQYTMNDGTSQYPDVAQPTASTAWKSETYRFTAPTNAKSVTVYHLINKVGTLSLDNVSLTDVTASTPPPPPPSGNNLIPNPSLEAVGTNGLPTSWAKGRWGTNTTNFVFPTAGEDGTNAARIDMTAYTSGDAKWYFNNISVTPGSTYQFTDYYKSNVTTYVTVQFTKSDGTTAYKDLGSAPAASSWTQYKGVFTVPTGVVSLTIFHVIKSIGSLEIDNYSLSSSSATPTDPTKFDKGYVSINFDDGWLDAYQNAVPILSNYGFKSDQFIITNRLDGSFPAYINSSQVMDLQNKGHIVGAHTVTHVDLTTLTTDQANQEIVGSKNDLLSIGIAPVSFFAYPFGAYNSTIQQLVKNAGFIAARSSDGGYNDKTTDLFALKRQPMVSSTTFADVKGYIDTAIANKTWVILLFHEVSTNGDQYAVTPALFAQIMDYLKQQNITPITIQQGVNMMKQ